MAYVFIEDGYDGLVDVINVVLIVGKVADVEFDFVFIQAFEYGSVQRGYGQKIGLIGSIILFVRDVELQFP